MRTWILLGREETTKKCYESVQHPQLLLGFRKTWMNWRIITRRHMNGWARSHLNIGAEHTFLVCVLYVIAILWLYILCNSLTFSKITHSFIGRAHCDLLINNLCEVFNRQLLDARDSPIITSLEYVREYLMKRIVIGQKIIQKIDRPLTPAVTSSLTR